jgi:hypothetical protein
MKTNIKKYLLITGLLAGLMYIGCTNDPVAGNGEETGNAISHKELDERGIYGILVDTEGKPVSGAVVELYNVDMVPAISKTMAGVPDTTNIYGEYAIPVDSTDTSTYNIKGEGGNNAVVIIDSIKCGNDAADVDAGTDTLKSPGSVRGVVLLKAGVDLRGTLIYISGTNYMTATNINGEFMLGDVAEGTRTVTIVSRIDEYPPIDTTIQVKSGETYDLDTIRLADEIKASFQIYTDISPVGLTIENTSVILYGPDTVTYNDLYMDSVKAGLYDVRIQFNGHYWNWFGGDSTASRWYSNQEDSVYYSVYFSCDTIISKQIDGGVQNQWEFNLDENIDSVNYGTKVFNGTSFIYNYNQVNDTATQEHAFYINLDSLLNSGKQIIIDTVWFEHITIWDTLRTGNFLIPPDTIIASIGKMRLEWLYFSKFEWQDMSATINGYQADSALQWGDLSEIELPFMDTVEIALFNKSNPAIGDTFVWIMPDSIKAMAQ